MDLHHLVRLLFISIGMLLIFIDGELWRRAFRHADYSLEKAAQWMQMDPRHLDRQLKGEEHNILKYNGAHGTDKLPLEIHKWHAFLKSVQLGLPLDVDQSLPLILAVNHDKKLVAIMNLPDEQKEERSA
jgi:hypothetical protein